MDVLIQPDEAQDSLYICFAKDGLQRGVVARSVRVNDDVTVDFGKDGRLVGLDIMNASTVIQPDYAKVQLDSLVGVKEAAELVGVQKSNFVRDHANKPDFPAPVTELATGRIWLRSQIEQYLAARRSSEAKRPRRMRAAS